MAGTLALSAWTGTKGIFEDALPDDWDEARQQVQERTVFCKEPAIRITPTLVAEAWRLLLETFGEEAKTRTFTVQELVEFYLDS